MTKRRLKQIGLALGLVASLFLGHASAACVCSHHEPVEKPVKGDCHSHGGEDSTAKTATENQALTKERSFDTRCVCYVQSGDPAASVQTSKKSKSNDHAVVSGSVSELAHVTLVTRRNGFSDFNNQLSYSNTLDSLLPSRAPPRL